MKRFSSLSFPVLLLVAGAAAAQQWPAKPVRIIVPFPPGQAADIVTRVVAECLTPALGQQVIIDEQGVRGYDVRAWTGLVAPAGTPAAILDRMNKEVVRILAVPEVKTRLSDLSLIPIGNTRERFSAYLKSELAKWANAVKVSGAKVE